jgi:hypothetical protein
MTPCGIRPLKVTDLHDITEILLKVALSNIFTNKTDCHDITEILLKAALNTTTLAPFSLTFVI